MNENREISSLSYVNKDFGAIYPEMLDLAKQLTNKWDPSQSNESDPGVVLLKEGAFVADHNNYNIDKNILEAFLPSATQDRSVRNITEMNGYTPRYYVSANGDVTFTWKQPEGDDSPTSFSVPAFTFVLSDADETVSYTQVEDLVISGDKSSTCRFIEGTLQTLAINDNSVISLENLDDNNRLYLPETMVAQNGIYIRNYVTGSSFDDDNSLWTRNNYLLTQPLGSKIYKIDYDSMKLLPYIEFPSDIANLIGDGLQIQYIATSGEQGNVSANTLTKILSPSKFINTSNDPIERSSENFTVNNYSAISNGKDPETIEEMYQSFRRVVGTFDTLVTCKDYENKIYSLTDNIDNPLVSNVYVTDRRTDYNKSAQIMSWDIDTSTQKFKTISTKKCALSFKGEATYSEILAKNNSAESADLPGDMLYCTGPDSKNKGIYVNMSSTRSVVRYEKQENINLNDFAVLSQAMTPYDLVMYPLKAYEYNPNNLTPDRYWVAFYDSFKPVSPATREEIKIDLQDYKCISHTWNDPSDNDVYCFKNYAFLDITIFPYKKVTKFQRDEIIDNIRMSLSEKFNPRNINFGEMLDREELENAIVSSDSRIRRVEMKDIKYTTKVMYSQEDRAEEFITSELMKSLVAKNVLAGRLCMFSFNDDFKYSYGQLDGKVYSNESSAKTELYIPLTTAESAGAVYDDSYEVKKSATRYDTSNGNYKYSFMTEKSSGDTGVVITNGNEYELRPGKDTFTLFEVDSNERIVKTIDFSSNIDTKIIVCNRLDGDVNLAEGDKVSLSPGDIIIKKEASIKSMEGGVVNLDYTLNKNEAIQIIYPNYYSDTTYSVYVNYRYECDDHPENAKILANTDYTLKAGERIILIYSKNGSQKTDILYPGDVVNSSLDLIPTDLSASTGIKKSWTDTLTGQQIADKGFKQLGTNQTISKRKLMTTKLDSTGIKCYWIVPSDQRNNMVLFEGNDTSRILKSGEYFIYTNSAMNEMMILGSGTKIERQFARDASQWSIPKNTLTIESISNIGLQKSDFWQSIDFSKNNLYITEMNVLTLGENDKIRIWGWSSDKMPRVVDGTETKYAFNINGYDASSQSNDEDGFSICNGNIEYTVNGTKNSLPAIDNFYSIKSRLDLNVGPGEEQELITTRDGASNIVSSQRVMLSYNDTLETISSDDNEKFIQASENVVGLGNVIKLVNKTNFFSYSKDGISYSKGVKLTEASRLSVSYPFFCDDISKIHMIPVHMTGSEVPVTASFAIKVGDDLTTINIEDYNSTSPASSLTLNGNNSYYLVPSGTFVPDNSELVLQLKWSKSAEHENESLLIDDVVVIDGVNENISNVISLNELSSEIKSILAQSDKPSIKPYYPYRLDNSIAMNTVDFKDASAMWDKNNVANKMTIAQIDLQNSIIDVDITMRSY